MIHNILLYLAPELGLAAVYQLSVGPKSKRRIVIQYYLHPTLTLKRKLLVALGYGLAAFTKPVFPLASSVGWVVSARFIDRIGKGIRGAPRDALVADISPAHLRGASFGLRQSLDTIGAFVGP